MSDLPGFGGSAIRVQWPSIQADPGSSSDKTRGNTGPIQAIQDNRALSPNRSGENSVAPIRSGAAQSQSEPASCAHGTTNKPGSHGFPGSDQQRRGFERSRLAGQPGSHGSEAEVDPADWVGEYEAELPPLPDYGDESELEAWLSGVPVRELGK